jgi:imidazole glycerol-phosphate synthase subunit HisH
MIVIIDYGIGNLRSVQKAFEAVGAEVKRSRALDEIRDAEKLVLPGVGAFGACMDALNAYGLADPLREAVHAEIPLLGVCVGMQMLFEGSDEMGEHEGLGLLPGRVTRFPADMPGENGRPLKVPHMGWNRLDVQQDHPILSDLGDDPFVYFVHSYRAIPVDARDTTATSHYGIDFPAVVARNRVSGVQFHPEKSHRTGLRILRNFVERF